MQLQTGFVLHKLAFSFGRAAQRLLIGSVAKQLALHRLDVLASHCSTHCPRCLVCGEHKPGNSEAAPRRATFRQANVTVVPTIFEPVFALFPQSARPAAARRTRG